MVAGAFKSGGETVNTFSVDYTGNDVHFKASEFQPNSDPYYVKKVSSYFNVDFRKLSFLYSQALSRGLLFFYLHLSLLQK
jgi:hypothetical protein